MNIRGAREGLYFKLSDTNDRATIAIKDNDVPAVTISPHEFTNPDVLSLPDSYAMFEVTTNTPPHERLEIKYELAGLFPKHDTSVTLPAAAYIEAGETSGILRIKTAYSESEDIIGSIGVRLLENTSKPNSYYNSEFASRTNRFSKCHQ